MIVIKKNKTKSYDVFYNERWLISKPTRRAAYRWGRSFVYHLTKKGKTE